MNSYNQAQLPARVNFLGIQSPSLCLQVASLVYQFQMWVVVKKAVSQVLKYHLVGLLQSCPNPIFTKGKYTVRNKIPSIETFISVFHWIPVHKSPERVDSIKCEYWQKVSLHYTDYALENLVKNIPPLRFIF